jgi:hypothetical protein
VQNDFSVTRSWHLHHCSLKHIEELQKAPWEILPMPLTNEDEQTARRDLDKKFRIPAEDCETFERMIDDDLSDALAAYDAEKNHKDSDFKPARQIFGFDETAIMHNLAEYAAHQIVPIFTAFCDEFEDFKNDLIYAQLLEADKAVVAVADEAD